MTPPPTPGADRTFSMCSPSQMARGWMEPSTRIGNGNTAPNAKPGLHPDRDADRDQPGDDPCGHCSPELPALHHAREGVCAEAGFVQLRSLISQYTLDKQKAPQALDDLITAGYLKQIPIDPMTNARDTWTVEQEDTLLSVDQQEPGISDVHSGSNAISSDGTAYSTW